jgi:uncharacterized protein (DUF4415 family)
MSEKNLKKESKTDWDRIDAMTDEDIDISDIPPLDEGFFTNAQIRMPKPKETVTIRLDSDVVTWFKGQGKGYQTKINAVLRAYMEAQKKLRKAS